MRSSVAAVAALLFAAPARAAFWPAFDALLARHAGRTGVGVLEKGEESLLARAWLSDRARESVDVQYFIWSADNVGTLAAERLLSAAERGAKVRVLVDDFLVDASDEALLALAAHPAVEIRIYNPKHRVGVTRLRRALNLLTGFRDANQRMHDKVFVVDGKAAIVGGRNMADEYYDYDREYDFRDRDVLLLGPAAAAARRHFETFWASPLAVPVERLLGAAAVPSPERRDAAYRGLHRYAANPANLEPGPREALRRLPERFDALLKDAAWEKDVRFIGDVPGKNDSRGLGGGGRTTSELAAALGGARRRVVIQSPYLVLSKDGLRFFEELARRVEVRIVTNSFASTDNLHAFSGYLNIRRRLLAAGIKVFEFKPRPAAFDVLLERGAAFGERRPVLAIHAKSFVVDGETAYVGTFNLDPRSANLNTEVGVLARSPALARRIEAAIERDMSPENSWDAASGEGDRDVSRARRLKVALFRLLPLEPLL